MTAQEEIDPNYLTWNHIHATNRTTYAVRGLLRYLVVTAVTRIIGGALIWLAFGVGGLNDPNGFFLFIGILVIGIGEVLSAVVAMQELKQSEPSPLNRKGIRFPSA